MISKIKGLKLLLMGLCALSLLWAGIWLLPFDTSRLEDYPAGTVLTDCRGTPMRISLGEADQDCRPVQAAEVSDWATKAIIAAEDKRFKSHKGVDLLAIMRAVGQNVWYGRRISGASTLSTQVIRLAEPRPRTLKTKLVETFKAFQMECRLSKNEILQQHLNRAPFGSNRTGIESASRLYFGKSAAALSLPEAALLMGLPQAPTRHRPDLNPASAKKRMAYVLERMKRCGYISEEIQLASLAFPVNVKMKPRPFEAPHFCDYLLKNHAQEGTVKTTLDLRIQRQVEQVLEVHSKGLKQSSIHGAAVVVLDVETGALRAMAGSPDYFDRQHDGMVNCAIAERSPGSALKTFIYAMALEQGMITPEAKLEDSPMVFRDRSPVNFDEKYYGEVSVREALVHSLNIPALKLAREIGQKRVVEKLREVGLNTLTRPAEEYGLTIALGSGEVRLLDLANAYACLARGGIYKQIQMVEYESKGRSTDPQEPTVHTECNKNKRTSGSAGQIEKQTFNSRCSVSLEGCANVQDIDQSRLYSEETAYLVADILGGDERNVDIFGSASDAPLPRIAWKTGTSSGFRDAWTMAWNPEYVVGVWLGNPDGSGSPKLVGAVSAAPIAGDIFRGLYAGKASPWYRRPETVKEIVLADGARDLYVPGISIIEEKGAISDQLQIISPVDGSRYKPLNTLERQEIELRARGAGEEKLHWFASGQYLGFTDAQTPLYWPLQKGEWQLTCSSGNGATVSASISVFD